MDMGDKSLRETVDKETKNPPRDLKSVPTNHDPGNYFNIIDRYAYNVVILR
jgi:hypothetical protein